MSIGSPDCMGRKAIRFKLVPAALIFAALCFSTTLAAQGQDAAQQAPSASPSAQNPDQTLLPSATSPGNESQGSAPLRVMVGKSLLINTTERLKRVSVTDPAVADALVVTPPRFWFTDVQQVRFHCSSGMNSSDRAASIFASTST